MACYPAHSYDMGRVLAEAIAIARPVTPKRIRDALERVRMVRATMGAPAPYLASDRLITAATRANISYCGEFEMVSRAWPRTFSQTFSPNENEWQFAVAGTRGRRSVDGNVRRSVRPAAP